ncbi:hypothetical protein [Janibacter sp. DB-40]|uniref:hypothetical protein n=1 Tax=Janibacter sp. DB-40 TaxID=3028808 RepID=UPI00240588FE|nr:hypothetical protein [Janibacter sp. DB-40]
MSAMPPPPPPGGDQSGYQPAPAYSSPGGHPGGPVMTTAPPSIVRAKYAMWAGAVLHLITVFTSFLGMDDMRAQLEEALTEQGVAFTDGTIDAALAVGMAISVGMGVIGVVLWLLMAWLNGKGKGWARIVATVLFALFVISFLFSFAQATAVTMIVNTLVLLAGAAAIFFLWQKDSTAWFRAHKGV